MKRLVRLVVVGLAVALLTQSAFAAACMNRFRVQTEGDNQVVTLLSGALTFQEAQALSMAIKRGNVPGLEWLDAVGKSVAKQAGDLRVIRPMPVGCGNKTSGVVMTVTFPSPKAPAGKMLVRFEGKAVVEFSEQSD